MISSMPIATLWQQIKQTGLVLIFLGLLTLLILFGLVGAVISHAPQGVVPPAVPHGGLMAPTPAGSGGADGGPTGIATTNGNIHIGG